MKKDLSGIWGFRADKERIGIRDKWFLKSFEETIRLPGTMEENGYGERPEPTVEGLSHTLSYSGWAWYQTDFTISDFEASQCICFFMEKIPRDSYIWVDEKYYGTHNNLCTPHEYNFTGISAGKHRLTVLIDNSNLAFEKALLPLSDEEVSLRKSVSIHLHTDFDDNIKIPGGGHGKSCFNGIIGEIKLMFKPKIHIIRTSVMPDIKNNSVKLEIHLANAEAVAGKTDIDVFCDGDSLHTELELSGKKEEVFSVVMKLSKPVNAWDEFNPVCYTFCVECSYNGIKDYETIKCGLRELTVQKQHILINGNRLFFRATLEGDAYPLTGYEPRDIDFWTRAFTILKSYGLNGMRMHTFIPPRAAFDAAEQLGFYLQIELPGTSCPVKDEPQALSDFLWSELKRCLELYGNYACFIFMSMGNEQFISYAKDKEFPKRHQKVLMEKVDYAKKADPRHLYTCTSHPFTENRNDDFFVAAKKDKKLLNGIAWGGPDPIGSSRFDKEQPSTTVNYEKGIAEIDRPCITHEVGQWAVYPNFAEIPKYTGVLKPKNYEIFASELEKNGLLAQNADFVYNSGKLSLLLYKEEIESALRTADQAGFELLDIHDYPSQGTSTVGILDCFFDSKGLISPECFRNFCAPVVPLCSFKSFVLTSGDEITLTPSVANYSKNFVCDIMQLSVFDNDGNIAYQSQFDGCAHKGQLTQFSSHRFILKTDIARRLTVKFSIGRSLYNTWSIWIYPKELPESAGDVKIVTSLDNSARKLLKKGEKVLLIYPFGDHPENGNRGSFTNQFWNPFMKPQEAHNGIMCDPKHPLFNYFPTESHTDYQWWEIIMKSYPFYLDKLPLDFFPIVQLVPGIKDNKKIGLIWECVTESGKLLICTADLLDVNDRPAARQLKYSILKYMNSISFTPQKSLPFELINDVLK